MPSNEPPKTGLDKYRTPRRVGRRHILFLDALLMAFLVMLLGLPAATSWAMQQKVQYGRTLDANMKLGSGGYNRHTRAPSRIQRNRYAVGSYAGRGRAGGSSRSLYAVDRTTGDMSYTRKHSFAARSRYRSTGYSGSRYTSSYHRSYRYQGRGYR